MTTAASGHTTGTGLSTDVGHTPRPYARRGEETKPSWKTTELAVYVLAVIGVLIASAVTGDPGSESGGDVFAADKAWWFITLLTVGYMVSRGLAKAASSTRDRDPRTD
jgi:hypothetical protein